ncbi:MAG: hypothetical protein HY923_05415 [Elusimicrobia bacterium]|nr:hypothetical protein [Elusimicrobiota bacterium]
MRRHSLILIAALACAGCGKNKAWTLQFVEEVYVQVDAATYAALNKALGPGLENYGDVKAGPDVIKYSLEGSDIGTVMVLHTDKKRIPPGRSFQPMRTWQAFEAVLADPAVKGLRVILPEQDYTVRREEIAAALPKFPHEGAAKPLEIWVAK